MMMVEIRISVDRPKKANPVDSLMTRAQAVRRKFNAGRPHAIENKTLSPLEAIGRTCQLFDKLRDGMREAGLDPGDVMGGLVLEQPETTGMENIVRTIWLPTPERLPVFAEKIFSVNKPVFLGVLFGQRDREAANADKQAVAFIFPFRAGPQAEKSLLAARNKFVKGGHQALDD
jgi:hypothetical protein